MDVLQEHLVRARASGGVFARSVAEPPWGLRLPGDIQLAVHTVTHGDAWVWVESVGDAAHLLPGDLALVRGGQDHFIAHELAAPCLGHEDFWARERGFTRRGTVAAPATVFLCGAYRFEGEVGRSLIEALPPVMTVDAAADDAIQGVVTLLARELLDEEPGKQTVLDRLLDVLIVLGVRAGLKGRGSSAAWVRAAADPRLGPALEAIHARGHEPWTVDGLADLSNMSRASFARVFEQALGRSPIRYLTDWRMTLARDLLLDPERTLSAVAGAVGYSSSYAFATAFRRHHEESPGRWRRRVLRQL